MRLHVLSASFFLLIIFVNAEIEEFSDFPDYNYTHYNHAIAASLKLKNCTGGLFHGYILPGTDPQLTSFHIADDFSGFGCIDTNSGNNTAQLIGCTWKQNNKTIASLSTNNQIRKKMCNDYDCPPLEECKIINVKRTLTDVETKILHEEISFFARIRNFLKSYITVFFQ